MKRSAQNIGFASVLLAAALLPATAFSAEHDGQWHVNGEFYLWGADTELTAVAGQEIDADFNAVLDNLEMAFMGALGARKDRVSWFGDIMYVGIGGSKTVPATIPGVPVPLDAKVKLEQDAWIVTAGGGYAVSDSEHHFFDLMGGVRYFNLKTDIGIDFGGGLAGSLSDSSDVLDAFVGIKGRADLSDRWYLGYYADVGTGQSDLTWQVLADFNYEFSKVDLGFGYRILEWQLDGKSVLDKFQISGPYAGIIFKFK